MSESRLEETLVKVDTLRPLEHRRAYFAYLEAHKNNSLYKNEGPKPTRIGTGIFGALMSIPIAGVTYCLKEQLNNLAPYSQILVLGYVALDLTLVLTTALFGKLIWDYETLRSRS